MYRQLGIEEHLNWLYAQLKPIHFTLSANILGTLHLEKLQQALSQVQQRHPLLNAHIALDRAEVPWFIFIPDSVPIPIRLVARHTPQQWQQEVERELANPFDWQQAPLIRVVLLQGDDVADLIITCDHAIGDAMSVVFLLRDILQALESPDRQLPVLSPQPPCEQLVPQFPKRLPSSFKPALAIAKTKPTLPENSRPRLCARSLSTVETSAVLSACKQAQTSVHAAICAAFLLALAQQRTQPDDLNESAPLKCLSPIDLRRFLPGIKEDFGCYFTFTVTADQIDPNVSLWELARSIKNQLNHKLDPEQIFAHLPNSQAFISTLPSPEAVVTALEATNRYDLNVSNLGRLPIPHQYGDLQLAAVYGPSMTNHLGRELVVGVTTLGERMFFSLVYSESDYSSAQIDRLQLAAMQLLDRQM
jgi:Condensation domain/Alcohol acetyltransferase